MKRKELTCIVCPNGCPLEIDFEEKPVIQVIRVEGHTCDKGPQMGGTGIDPAHEDHCRQY